MDLYKIKASTLRRILYLWPPFLFSGIRIHAWSDDWRHARVRLKLRWYSRNFVGTQFGGSLFAMTDPFFMIMTLQLLGHDYMVWDKAAEIDFVAPGRNDVYAEFHVDDAVLAAMRAATVDGAKYLHWSETEVKTAAGDVVARVRKQVDGRRKRNGSRSIVTFIVWSKILHSPTPS